MADDEVKDQQEDEEIKDPFADFDLDLFYKDPVEIQLPDPEPETEIKGVCPFYPMTCDWVKTWRCTDKCKYNPDNYMQPEIKEVFDKIPHALYCFDCGKFVETRPHEGKLDPPELEGSHTVTTGFMQYRLKLTEWTLKRITGGDR